MIGRWNACANDAIGSPCAALTSSSSSPAPPCFVVTGAFLTDRSLSFALLDRSADVAVNSLTALAAASLAALALARYRESGRLAGLYQASAFLLIGWVALINVLVVIVKVDARFGLSLGDPEQLPLYVSSVSRLIAGGLLLVGGAAAVNMPHRTPITRQTLLVPTIVITRLHPRHVRDPRVATQLQRAAAGVRRPGRHEADGPGAELLGRADGHVAHRPVPPVAERQHLPCGCRSVPTLLPARRSRRRRLPGRGDADCRLRRGALLLLSGRLRRHSSRPAKRSGSASSSSC